MTPCRVLVRIHATRHYVARASCLDAGPEIGDEAVAVSRPLFTVYITNAGCSSLVAAEVTVLDWIGDVNPVHCIRATLALHDTVISMYLPDSA
jgi:hypothetical protein